MLSKYHQFIEKFDEKEIEFKIDQNDTIKIYGKLNPNNNHIFIKGYYNNNKEEIIPTFSQLINEMKEGKELTIHIRIDEVDEFLVFPLDNFKEGFEERKFKLD